LVTIARSGCAQAAAPKLIIAVHLASALRFVSSQIFS
jgi:hypothetical protein